MAVRALVSIAANPAGITSSEEIAREVGVHPVVLRRLLGRLRRAGLVESRSGPGGGWAIGRDPAGIGIDQVREALLDQPAEAHRLASPGDRLARIMSAAEAAYRRELGAHTVGDLLGDPPPPHS